MPPPLPHSVELPLILHHEGLDEIIVKYLHLSSRKRPDLSEWERIVAKIKNPSMAVTIGIVGKYVQLKDSYKSLSEALTHGGIANEGARRRQGKHRERTGDDRDHHVNWRETRRPMARSRQDRNETGAGEHD